MNSLLLFAVFPATAQLIQLLIYVAIAAVVVWAIIALVRWSGIPIPQPVWIILTAFLAIAAILLMARMFGLLI